MLMDVGLGLDTNNKKYTKNTKKIKMNCKKTWTKTEKQIQPYFEKIWLNFFIGVYSSSPGSGAGMAGKSGITGSDSRMCKNPDMRTKVASSHAASRWVKFI